MKLLVTGATGFLGKYVVAEALRRGHAVKAVVRSVSGADCGWADHPNLTRAKVDLRSRRGLTEAVAGVDCVIHLAAAKSGDLYAQYAGTVVATENLLAAMAEASVSHIVLCSSLSVYDYLKIQPHTVLTEESPLETDAFDRDEYAHTKLVQERLVRDTATRSGWKYSVLRPGVIYGKENFFTARLGIQAGKIWIRTGASACVPLTYVENCAEAIVSAAEMDSANGQTLNVIDDNPPSQRVYARMLARRMNPSPKIIGIPWAVMKFLAGSAVAVNRLFCKGQAKIPGLFIPARLHARCRPLRFNNEKIKRVLKWKPRYSLEQSLDRSMKLSIEEMTRVTPGAISSQPTSAVARPAEAAA